MPLIHSHISSYSGSETPSSLVASFLKNWGLKHLLIALIDNLKNNNPKNEAYINNVICSLTMILVEYESRYDTDVDNSDFGE